MNGTETPSTPPGSEADRADYRRFLAEYGLSEGYVRSVVEDLSDHAEMPGGFDRFVRAPSAIHGDGLFAVVDIPAGSLVAPARIGDRRTVAGRFTNHARAPNCVFVETAEGGLDMRAARDVVAGEELTVNYRQVASVNPYRRVPEPK